MDPILAFTTATYVFHRAAGVYRHAMLNQGEHEKLGKELTAAFTSLKQVAPAALQIQPDLQRVLATAANEYRQCRQMEAVPLVTFPDPIFTAAKASQNQYEYTAPQYDPAPSASQYNPAPPHDYVEAERQAKDLRQFCAELARQDRQRRQLRYVAAFAVTPIVGLGFWLDLPLLFLVLGVAAGVIIMSDDIANYWDATLDRFSYPRVDPH
jgi:hypothetical protein